MSAIEVYRVAPDGLSREVWSFSIGNDYGSTTVGVILGRYAIERRKLPRGRFSSPTPSDRWMSLDERRYASGLDRPEAIPIDVMEEAESRIQFTFYIGFRNARNKAPAQGMETRRAGTLAAPGEA